MISLDGGPRLLQGLVAPGALVHFKKIHAIVIIDNPFGQPAGAFFSCNDSLDRAIDEAKKMSFYIRDPIHGFIEFDEWEKEIIDHPVFQRLRRIRQLGWTDMAYPGGTHARFEHSLGVMHVSTLMFDNIVRRRNDFLRIRAQLHRCWPGTREGLGTYRLFAA